MKYKLIKEYPGSPKFGTIVEFKTTFTAMGIYTTADCECCFKANYIENYPEFWQPLPETKRVTIEVPEWTTQIHVFMFEKGFKGMIEEKIIDTP